MSDPAEIIKSLSKVILMFEHPLNPQQFEYLKNCFGDKNFPIWGNPIILEPLKMHIYGVNKISWSQIVLEVTDKHVIAVFPYKEDLENIKSAIIQATGVELKEAQ